MEPFFLVLAKRSLVLPLEKGRGKVQFKTVEVEGVLVVYGHFF